MLSSSFYFIRVRDDCQLFIVVNCTSLITHHSSFIGYWLYIACIHKIKNSREEHY